MKIIITGASGFIGSALVPFLQSKGHTVVPLARKSSKDSNGSNWDPDKGDVDLSLLEGADAVINLSGESIAKQRWSTVVKSRLRRSRLHATRTLVETFDKLKNPPKLFINASAVGFYGNRGHELLGEDSPGGTGFLSELAREWETLASRAQNDKTRVVLTRFGAVLDPSGGALQKMLVPFSKGLGGPLGDGTQYMSWVALEDVIGAISFILENSTLKGPINIVAPNPVTNKEFTNVLAGALNKKPFFHVPAFALNLLVGEMAKEVLLISERAVPAKLLQAGYTFKYPSLEPYLKGTLAKSS